MNPILRNVLAVLAGLVIGSMINSGLIALGTSIVPIPPGTDTSTPDGLKAAIPLFEPIHFLFPFLAHAVGTLAGAFTAAFIAAAHKMKFALSIGVFFLLGGVAVAAMVPSPMWFTVADLILAYLPMAFLGGTLAIRIRPERFRPLQNNTP